MKVFPIFCAILAIVSANSDRCRANTLATVDGHAITSQDVRAFQISRRIPEVNWAQTEDKVVEMLIDQHLLRAYLKQRKAEPSRITLERQLAAVRKLADIGEEPLEDLLQRAGLTMQQLKDQLALPLMWDDYAKRAISDSQVREEFTTHRSHYDGTKVVARQIFLKKDEDTKDQIGKLNQIKSDIAAGRITFEEAAKKYSQAPSANTGGLIGKFPYAGRTPQAITTVAFTLKKNELSDPFETPFGYHLLQVTDIIPGQFSLEDAKPQIRETLSQALREKTLKQLRAKANVVRQ